MICATNIAVSFAIAIVHFYNVYLAFNVSIRKVWESLFPFDVQQNGI